MNNDDNNFFTWIGQKLYTLKETLGYFILIFTLVAIAFAGPIFACVIHHDWHAESAADTEDERNYFFFRIVGCIFGLYAWCLLAFGQMFDWFCKYWPALSAVVFDESGFGENYHGVALGGDFVICAALCVFFFNKSSNQGQFVDIGDGKMVFVEKARCL